MYAFFSDRISIFLFTIVAALAFSQPGFAQTSDLRISEIGSSSYYVDVNGVSRADVPSWFEIINVGRNPIDTAGYRIKSTAGDRAGRSLPLKIFDLPSVVLPPKGVLVFRGRRENQDPEYQDAMLPSRSVAFLGDNIGNYPAWRWSGFIELVRQGKTVDFVRFGASTQEPATAGHWQGASAAAMPYGQNRFGFALARDKAGGDSNKASDWTLRHFATPGGPNDVTCTDDADGDGFPDCSEQPGSTYAGLPLYEWGARPGTRDIFIEMDYMLHDQNSGPQANDDPGMIPQRAALERVRKAFKDRGIAIHLDVGSLFHQAKGTSPDDFDLGGGQPVPYREKLSFRSAAGLTGIANVYDYKRRYMHFARRQVFHYMIFGYRQPAPYDGSSGIAELPGNDFIVTLGGWGLNAQNARARNVLTNTQAGTILHEFGHNLGLRHGGSDHDNYKPVYLSSMNYLFQTDGLPDTASASAGDRYYRAHLGCGSDDPKDCPPPPGCARYVPDGSEPQDSPTSAPETFRIDYSDGQGGNINEEAVDERKGYGRPGSAAIDFNCDGVISTTPITYNIDDVPDLTVLRDYNDWQNIKIFFQRLGEGDRSGLSVELEKLKEAYPNVSIRAADKVLPVAKDKQPLSEETVPSPEFFKRVRELSK